MKEFLKDLLGKWIIGVTVTLICTFGSAIYGTIKALYYMPQEIDEPKALHTQDPARAVEYMRKMDSTIISLKSTIGSQGKGQEPVKREVGKIKNKPHLSQQ